MVSGQRVRSRNLAISRPATQAMAAAYTEQKTGGTFVHPQRKLRVDIGEPKPANDEPSPTFFVSTNNGDKVLAPKNVTAIDDAQNSYGDATNYLP